MTLDLDALEATARAVCVPEAWTIWHDLDHQGFKTVGDAESYAEMKKTGEADECDPIAHVYTDDLAEHIATFDPPTVLALIERVERAEAERESTVKEMHARELHHFEEEKLRAEAEAKLREAEQERDEARWAAGIVGDVARESSGGWQDAAAELHATQARLREAEAVIAEALELIATVKAAGEVPVDVFTIERILARSKPTNQEGES